MNNNTLDKICQCMIKYTLMTWDEIKKYDNFIKFLARKKANRYIECEDLISACHEKLLKVKIRKKNAYKKYVECMIRFAISEEIRKYCPHPFRRKMIIPEHTEFCEYHIPPDPSLENHVKRIYEQEKIKEIMSVCTTREKEFISLFLKDLNLREIREKMKISNVRVHEIKNNIRKRLNKIT